jgi:hypothetical protein
VFFVSLLVEFLGVCFFQFLGGSVNPKSPMVPWWVSGAGSLAAAEPPSSSAQAPASPQQQQQTLGTYHVRLQGMTNPTVCCLQGEWPGASSVGVYCSQHLRWPPQPSCYHVHAPLRLLPSAAQHPVHLPAGGAARDNSSKTLCRLHRMHCATGIGFPRCPCMVVLSVHWISAYHARLSFSGGVCKQT